MSAGVSLTEHEAMLAVESELLGSFSVPTDSTFTFADGILGFPEARRFVLIPAERDGFFWLQSTEFGALAFLVADPFPIVPEFSVELTDAEVKMLEPTDGAELAVLAIVTLPRDHDHAPSLNLQGPLVLNMKQGLGRQLVLQDSRWGVRWTVDLGDRDIEV
jgi:flagellar assembly factor FliW